MFKKLIFSFCIATLGFANQPFETGQNSNKVVVQNAILAKVNNTTISVLDVKKRMDMAFYKNFSHLADSPQAIYQFYDTSWKKVLTEMIDGQLILQEADQKKVAISEGEIREEIENRFGPNIMVTLDKMGLAYDEAAKMIKEEMLIQRMQWWFIYSKATNQITPQDIRQAYKNYLKENPSYDEYTYKILTIPGAENEKTAFDVHAFLQAHPDALNSALNEASSTFSLLQVSPDYTATSLQLSDFHKVALESLEKGTISAPLVQKNKNGKGSNFKIFVLKEKNHVAAQEFENMANELKNKLTEKAVALEAASYIEKLRKTYSYYENTDKNLKPFSLQ